MVFILTERVGLRAASFMDLEPLLAAALTVGSGVFLSEVTIIPVQALGAVMFAALQMRGVAKAVHALPTHLKIVE
jgi:hypothetical protein